MQKLYVLVAMLCLFSIQRTADACSCGHEGPPFAFNKAKAVFIGKMLGGTEKLSGQDENGKASPIEAGKVRFAVEEVFKGKLATEITIEIASMEGTSCGPYGLKHDERYIVYAYGGKELGETIEGLEFSLPSGLNVRLIGGKVTWQDGNSAGGVEVMLLCPRSARRDGFAVEFGPTRTITD